MDNKAYQKKEIELFLAEQKTRDTLSPQDRKESQYELKKALEDEESFARHVATAVDHILAGNYGAGILLSYALCSKAMNRKAWLYSYAVSIEYTCSYSLARDSWKKLSKERQESLNELIEEMVENYDAEPVITLAL